MAPTFNEFIFGTFAISSSLSNEDVLIECQPGLKPTSFEDGKALYDQNKAAIDARLSEPDGSIHFSIRGEDVMFMHGAAIEGLLGPHAQNIDVEARTYRVSFSFGALSLQALNWIHGNE